MYKKNARMYESVEKHILSAFPVPFLYIDWRKKSIKQNIKT
jgi:hypothetical protein